MIDGGLRRVRLPWVLPALEPLPVLLWILSELLLPLLLLPFGLSIASGRNLSPRSVEDGDQSAHDPPALVDAIKTPQWENAMSVTGLLCRRTETTTLGEAAVRPERTDTVPSDMPTAQVSRCG